MNLKNRIRKIEEAMLKSSPDDLVEQYARTLLKDWVTRGLIEGPVKKEKVSSLKEKIKPSPCIVRKQTISFGFS